MAYGKGLECQRIGQKLSGSKTANGKGLERQRDTRNLSGSKWPKGKVWSVRVLQERYLFLMTCWNGHQVTGEITERKTPPTFQEFRHTYNGKGTVLGECISPPPGTQSQREIMGPATLQQPG